MILSLALANLGGNLAELYDKVAAIAEAEEESKKAAAANQGTDKMVRMAAGKFKKKRNMKKVKEKQKKQKKAKHFESLVDQIMSQRKSEDRR